MYRRVDDYFTISTLRTKLGMDPRSRNGRQMSQQLVRSFISVMHSRTWENFEEYISFFENNSDKYSFVERRLLLESREIEQFFRY